jgi:hypothetical protein
MVTFLVGSEAGVIGWAVPTKAPVVRIMVGPSDGPGTRSPRTREQFLKARLLHRVFTSNGVRRS